MILNQLFPKIESLLIPELSGLRPSKSCMAQILNLTQHVEDGFKRHKIIGAAFVDLTVEYYILQY